MFYRILPVFFLLGGCASLDNVIGGIGNAPEWFQERRVEIRGSGYPVFSEVPAILPTNALRRTFSLSADQMADASVMFDIHPRAQTVDRSPDEIEADVDAIRSRLGELPPLSDPILSEEEIAALLEEVQKHRP